MIYSFDEGEGIETFALGHTETRPAIPNRNRTVTT
jgi:hypothetical protein